MPARCFCDDKTMNDSDECRRQLLLAKAALHRAAHALPVTSRDWIGQSDAIDGIAARVERRIQKIAEVAKRYQ